MIYRIDETERVVHVVHIDHRADVYRVFTGRDDPQAAFLDAALHTGLRDVTWQHGSPTRRAQ